MTAAQELDGLDLEELRAVAADLGVQLDGRWGADRVRSEIVSALAGSADATPEPAPPSAGSGVRVTCNRNGSVRLCKVGGFKPFTVPGGGSVEISAEHLAALREDRRTRIFFAPDYLSVEGE
jgi:hypothetical protein